MLFCWEEDPRAESEGVVVAVDVTRHARRAGFETSTFVSRGLWLRFIGAGAGQEQRLVDTLAVAARKMLKPVKASDDGTAALFGMQIRGGATVEVVSIVDTERNGVTFMLFREFACRPAGPRLRVRVVAKDDMRPQV